MINLFNNYTKKFDLSIKPLMGKYHHSFRVMEFTYNIAKSINLSEEDIELARYSGLLHDIARFRQWTDYNTYDDDESVDHGDLGSLLLIKHHLLYYLIPSKRVYDEDIRNIVKSHSKMNNSLDIDMNCIVKFRDLDLNDVFKPYKDVLLAKNN